MIANRTLAYVSVIVVGCLVIALALGAVTSSTAALSRLGLAEISYAGTGGKSSHDNRNTKQRHHRHQGKHGGHVARVRHHSKSHVLNFGKNLG